MDDVVNLVVPPTPGQVARATAYVRDIGTIEKYREQATKEVAGLLAAAESQSVANVAVTQLQLFDGGAQEPPRKTRAASAERLKNAAEALRTPQNKDAVEKAFQDGSTISSIIPELVRHPSLGWDIRGATIRKASDLAVLTLALRTPFVETFKLAILNADGKVLHSEIASIGSTTAALADAGMVARMLQRLPKQSGNTRIRVLATHNHPSGDVAPSSPDIHLTKSLAEACNQLGHELVDHIITNGESYYSFREAGLYAVNTVGRASRRLPEAIGRDVVEGQLGHKAPWEVVKRSELPTVNHPDIVAPIYQTLRQVDPTAVHVLYLNRKNRLLGIERVTDFSKTSDVLGLKRRMFAGVGREGASAFVILMPESVENAQAMRILRELREFGKSIHADLLDFLHPVIDGHFNSAAAAGLMEDEQPTYVSKKTKSRFVKRSGKEKRTEFVARLWRLRGDAISAPAQLATIDSKIASAISGLRGSSSTANDLLAAARAFVRGNGDAGVIETLAKQHMRKPRKRARAQIGRSIGAE